MSVDVYVGVEAAEIYSITIKVEIGIQYISML